MQEKPDFSELGNIRSNPLGADGLIVSAFIGVFAAFSLLAATQSLTLFLISFTIMLGAGFFMYKNYKDTAAYNLEVIRSFAQKNNFQFTQENKAILQNGSLYQHGHSKKESYIFEGTYLGLPMRMSNYEYTTGSGKNSEYFHLRVMRLTLPIRQPHMVIDCLIEDGDNGESSLPISFDNSQKIKLEGEFHKYFDLYAIDQYAVDALSVIAPDAMDAMMRLSAICDIEIIDNFIYFYWPDEKFSKAIYEQAFETVGLVMGEIQKKLTTRSPVQPKTMAATAQPATGVYLKKSTKLTPILIGCALFLVYMSPHIVPERYRSVSFLGPAIVVCSVLLASFYGQSKRHKGRQAYFSSRNVHRR